jgi:hypothetical protein
MKEKEVFIYALCCPLTFKPKYVGKTNDIRSRLNGHHNNLYNPSPERNSFTKWLHSLKVMGIQPRVQILGVCLDSSSVYFEKFYYNILSSEHTLLNNHKFDSKFYR